MSKSKVKNVSKDNGWFVREDGRETPGYFSISLKLCVSFGGTYQQDWFEDKIFNNKMDSSKIIMNLTGKQKEELRIKLHQELDDSLLGL